MVFSLPGAAGGLGGGGDYWDRNEGDGDWEEATDKQKARAKRLVASIQQSKISLEDFEFSDEEEEQELFDKNTGKKLTFNIPNAPPGAASRGRGRCKRNCNGRAGGKKKSEKTEERGEKEKGRSLEVEAPENIDPMETSDEPKGEKEKNPPLENNEKDVYEIGEKKIEPKGKKEKNPRNRCKKEVWVVARQVRGGNLAQSSVAEEKEVKENLFELNHEEVEVVPEYSIKKGSPPPQQKGKRDGDELLISERERNRRAQQNIKDKILLKIRAKVNEDINDDEPKGEKEKNRQKNDELEEKEGLEDLYELNQEDMEVIHKFPIKKGGPPPQQKCRYELIRDQIIADREALMRAVLADIQKTSREIVEENEKCKKRKRTNEGKASQEKKRKVEKMVDIVGARRSARERKPVTYCAFEDNDDPEWIPEGRKKKVERKRKRSDTSNDNIKDRKPLPAGWNPKWNPFEKKNRKNASSDEAPSSSGATTKRSTRPKKAVNYNVHIPHADEFVFCDKCGEDKYHGCELHPLIFDYVAHFDVGPSKVGKNAGRGVFNNDFCGDIPEGVMFGPYDGTFYTVEEYEILKQTRGESGFAWELTDPDKIKVIGYVDPGPDPDPFNQWMSIVNCSSKTRHQNLMSGQFIGGIYYRSIKIIHYGEELQVYYGNDYARDIKIKVEERDLYELYEDWEEEGVSCPHCGGGFVKQEFLQKHIDRADNPSGGCSVLRREKNRADILAGLKSQVCGDCGKGFKFACDLNKHKATHSDARPYVCPECGKAYKDPTPLRRHVKAEHEGQTFDCPDCERPFKWQSAMMTHWKNVCNRDDQEFKCGQCGRKFNRNTNLTKHIKEVHNRELPYKCEVCDNRFAQKSNLQRHIQGVHEKARPHVCQDCGATYQTAVRLDHHRIRTHTLQWYWNCDVCDAKGIEKGFLVPSDLKQHMLVHHPAEYKEQIEREKPAVCPKCQKRFPNEEQVASHVKKMHNE